MNTQEEFIQGAVHSLGDGVHAGSHLAQGLHDAVLGTVRRYNPFMRRESGMARRIYATVRTVASLAGRGGVRAVALAGGGAGKPLLPWQLHWVSGFNAAWGDFYAEQEHPWALSMGYSLDDDPAAFATGVPAWLDQTASPHLMVFVHGLGMNELAWGGEQGYARELARDHGMQPLMLRYNTGLPIHDNGERFAEKLEQLIEGYPVSVESLTLIGHSMGGLVSLSAGYYGLQRGYRWTSLLKGVACIGSPHRGARLEWAGNWFTHLLSQTTYSAPLSLIGKRRSAGIKDLRHGSLRAEDWEDRDRDHVEHFHPHPVPMLPGVRYLAIATTLPQPVMEKGLGDGLVTPDSALEPRLESVDEKRLTRLRLEGVGHLAQLTHPEVGRALQQWLHQRSD